MEWHYRGLGIKARRGEALREPRRSTERAAERLRESRGEVMREPWRASERAAPKLWESRG
eukprot:7093175-Pyramimonas_sp.AAC.1